MTGIRRDQSISILRFLQFGSPHGLSAQAQYVAEERSEVWVNIGYRLSVFGFLACDEPKIDGNFGFKDQWLALQWIQENIEGFGGNRLLSMPEHRAHGSAGQVTRQMYNSPGYRLVSDENRNVV